MKPPTVIRGTYTHRLLQNLQKEPRTMDWLKKWYSPSIVYQAMGKGLAYEMEGKIRLAIYGEKALGGADERETNANTKEKLRMQLLRLMFPSTKETLIEFFIWCWPMLKISSTADYKTLPAIVKALQAAKWNADEIRFWSSAGKLYDILSRSINFSLAESGPLSELYTHHLLDYAQKTAYIEVVKKHPKYKGIKFEYPYN